MHKILSCYKYSNGICNTQSIKNIEKEANSEVTKSKRGRKKKTDTKINEEEENDVRDKTERLITCILSGNSKNNI